MIAYVWNEIAMPIITGSVLLYMCLSADWVRDPTTFVESAWRVLAWIMIVIMFSGAIINVSNLFMKVIT